MDQERWRRVEELFHAALERAPEARQAFLDVACGGDTDLRRQVELLLAKEEEAGSFLETPAMRDMTVTLTAAGSLLGRQFGPYRIVSPLGAGGMGEVYRAHDSKLGRDVAIKTLPAEFARDPERLARFRREARTLASLNHPNIAAIYGLEESGRVDCLVLELVEGETLRGPLPVERALDYARQVAEALEAAHDKGIIHRDLKPANVKVTPQGRVKVLDFGLGESDLGTGAESGSLAIGDRDGRGDPRRAHCRHAWVHEPGAGARQKRSTSGRTSGLSDACCTNCSPASARFTARSNRTRLRPCWNASRTGRLCPRRHRRKSANCCGSVLQKDAGRRLQQYRGRAQNHRGSAARIETLASGCRRGGAVRFSAIGAALWMRGPARPPDRSAVGSAHEVPRFGESARAFAGWPDARVYSRQFYLRRAWSDLRQNPSRWRAGATDARQSATK